MPTELPRTQLRNVLHAWRDDLIDLTGRNRLLNFRHTRTATLAIREPSAGPLLAGLDTGWRFADLPEAEAEEGNGDEAEGGAPAERPDLPYLHPAQTDDIVTQKTTQQALNSSLRKLYRDSNQVFNDTGLWTLQLAAGFLRWRDPGAEAFNSAPLLLVPAQLERLGPGRYRLIAEEGEDAVPNPALAVKMAQLDLAWPAADDMKDLDSTLTLVGDAIAGQSGWEIIEDVVLATFRSHKEAMYRDLLDHEDTILAHPLVQAIGLGPQSELPDDALSFEPVDSHRIDELQPPEETPLVLDADSSQRQCVAAALGGHSFVMDGPPGTGKSQTIANIIAALMHQGRSILFVSEKAAALDVVRNRLKAVGLDSFLLPLHSHHASRKEVAKELGRALTLQPRAMRTSSDESRRLLRRKREQLSAYAAAMNEERPPFDASMHEVIGRVSALTDVPLLPTGLPSDLQNASMEEILAAARMAGDSWRPVVEGTEFPWYGLKSAASPHGRLRMVVECAESLRRRLAAHAPLTEPMGLTAPRDTERVLALLDAASERPPIPDGWLSTSDLHELRQKVDDFISRVTELRTARSQVMSDVGPEWDLLPAGLGTGVPADEGRLMELAPEGLALASLTASQARRLADDFRATAAMLRQTRSSLADVAAAYGMPAPRTADQALTLCSLTDFARAEHRPESAWFSATGWAAAAQAASELQNRLAALAAAKAATGEAFTEGILSVPDFPAVAGRVIETHGLGRLSGAHRADRRMLGALTHSGEWHKSVVNRLPQAIAWHEADQALRYAVSIHAPALGRYWQGDRTAFSLIGGLLESARRISQASANLQDGTALLRQVGADGRPDLDICALGQEIRDRIGQWRSTLVPAPRPGGRTRLGLEPLEDAATWYAAHVDPLEAAAQLMETVQAASAQDGEPTLAQARHMIQRVHALRGELRMFEVRSGADAMVLRVFYDGLETDLDALRKALDWVASVRSEGTPIPEEAATALLGERPDDELRRSWNAFRAAAADFTLLFDDSRRSLLLRLTGSFAELGQETDRLAVDESGPDEWRSLREARAVLQRYGLAGLIDRAAEQGLPGETFARVMERAVLEAWVENVFSSDPRLKPVRAVEHDRLVDEFRTLDTALVENAHAQVIDACNARRPRTGVGQAAIIQREAEKKKRHMPVRTLLERTADVVPLVKPCFMMSPLTVSQFLPAGYRFDVVIFDEASQVLPQDAINCVYRGDALIVAGDQKQLPPTNFFAQSEDQDDEYDEDVPDSHESLLDMCKASGLIRSLSLRWHYRSRHEGLIAFSNRSFYDGDLVTFPGARESGGDVGVTFTKVAGIYERGRTRRNPLEARTVAERVLHHYTARPSMSLGVVAMSEAQAQAIEEAVEEARAGRPDLDRYFTEDRLNGFFVKNLETVQGDERDVILLSVGYGPDQNNKFTMAFGPLNRENGWRRLNVAVTRARNRVEVIASFSAGAIRDSDNKSRNHFKRYLDYAERGPLVLEHAPVTDDAAPESPFEESVLAVMEGWGYEVQPQVGVSGYRIDMAVRHPDAPGRFALGIECDGAMYHSSRAARDRDRLRESVLCGLGWELYRIWGTDWYRHRNEAEERLRQAVEAAIARPIGPAEEEIPHSAAPDDVAPPAETPDTPRVTMETTDGEHERAWAARYKMAQLEFTAPPMEMHVPEARELMRRVFRKILELEAPIQSELLFRRTADAWGGSRIGPRIRDNLSLALSQLLQMEPEVERKGETITLRGRAVVAREPADQMIRRIAEVPPVERRAAMLGVIGESPGISEDELTTLVARFFGWGRRGQDITRALAEDMRALVIDGRIEGLPDRITLL
ncbi:DUF3320 domain-containing protein [Actinomadura sp. 9N407]|uniref:DUF3320 domain-containing protein n=1 Tax=Actinomadura sp. 9N407 TaxID=3375154 RepID=UPI003792507D